MNRQSHGAFRWLAGLCLGLVGLVLAAPVQAQDTRSQEGYQISLRPLSEPVEQHEKYLLTAKVEDSQGRPVNGVPVTFRIQPDWQQVASVSPQQVMAKDGEAQAIFYSGMTGNVQVTAQAGGAQDTATITVSGAGSSISSNSRSNRGPVELPSR